MMKKFLASALSAAMLLSLLAGCGGNSASSGSAASGSQPAGSTGSSSAAAGDKVVKIGVFEPGHR